MKKIAGHALSAVLSFPGLTMHVLIAVQRGLKNYFPWDKME